MRTELHGGEIFVSALVSAVIAIVAAILVEVAAVAVGMEFTPFVTVVLTTVAVFAVEVALVVSGGLAELCGAPLLAGGIFPTALLARFLRYDSDGALFAFLLFAFAVVGVFFAFFAREEFLAFGFSAAA